MSEEEKQFIINQADMYLSGMSYRQIAKEVGQSHVTVRTNITERLRKIDLEKYYKVLEKVEENTEKTIEDEGVRRRIIEEYKLLVLNNKSVPEIAAIMSITENTVYRDITNRLRDLNKTAPEIITDDMVRRSLETLRKHSSRKWQSYVMKDEFVKESHISEYLTKFFPSEEKRMIFIRKCIFTFGLRLPCVAKILQTDEEMAKKLVLENSKDLYEPLMRVFNHSLIYEEEAMSNFVYYFSRLVWTVKNKPRKYISQVLMDLEDKAIKCRLDKVNGHLTDEQIILILKYQLKYLYSTTYISEKFSIKHKTYADRVRNLKDKIPRLVSYFDSLSDFYNSNNKGRKM